MSLSEIKRSRDELKRYVQMKTKEVDRQIKTLERLNEELIALDKFIEEEENEQRNGK